MDTSEIKAELSVRMLDLEKAIDAGMPYQELKRIYSEIKELQYRCALANIHDKAITPHSNDLIIE